MKPQIKGSSDMTQEVNLFYNTQNDILISFAHICISVKFLGHIFRQIYYVTAELNYKFYPFSHTPFAQRCPTMETKSKKPIWILFLFTFGYLTENKAFPLTRSGKRPHEVFIRLCVIIVTLLTKKKIIKN